MFFFLQWVAASASGSFGAHGNQHCHRWLNLSSDTFFFDNTCFYNCFEILIILKWQGYSRYMTMNCTQGKRKCLVRCFITKLRSLFGNNWLLSHLLHVKPQGVWCRSLLHLRGGIEKFWSLSTIGYDRDFIFTWLQLLSHKSPYTTTHFFHRFFSCAG